ncbi:polyglutamate biosynthesis protein [Aspergillus arachidicola]|uniref:Polyglutamate biosynthesis protein n=1 Tax=Aspergillus arachidicola TaxID=656916 RepID=A0A2G7G0S4_9EURO|nr:polyglutamate biosynthesis protein [Aspergillus arachidicola]
MPPPKKVYTLTFTGDVMLGRLIDQLLPIHLPSQPNWHTTITQILKTAPSLNSYSYGSPWGTSLPLLHASDLNIINLETAVTTSDTPWPNKAFNYRMHPRNLEVLQKGRIDYVSLANNHTVDFGVEGLQETVEAVRGVGIGFAGVGDRPGEAAVLGLGGFVSDSSFAGEGVGRGSGETKEYKIHIYSASDHPRAWSNIPQFNFIDYSPATRAKLKTLLTSGEKPALKVFSVHWGPNYAWRPAGEIRALARFLVDECGVDIVHGHSAHHVQGVEVYRGRLIMYGCGDFVDDYALNGEFRNDLGALWRVLVSEDGRGGLSLGRLEVVPTRCRLFEVEVLGVEDEDHAWVRERVGELSREFGTVVEEELGRDGQVIVDLG